MKTLLASLLISTALAVELPPQLQEPVEEAQGQGLPVGALTAKALEGLAKGVPAARIEPVLDKMVADLSRAAQLLPAASGPEIEAASFALGAGAGPELVQGLSSQGTLSVSASNCLADLLRQGFTAQDAETLLVAALDSGDPDRALTGLATASATLLAGGQDHSQVAGSLQLVVSQGASPLAGLAAGQGGLPWQSGGGAAQSAGNNAGGNGNGNANGQNGTGNGNNGNGNGNGSGNK